VLRATMRLLDRYVAREIVSHAFLGLVVFTFVFFIPQLVRLMDLVVRHSGHIWAVLLLFLCTLPPVLGFTIPMGVLVGVLIGLGRLSADSEIVALHASGISLRRLLLPIGVIALVAAGGTLLTTFWLSPIAIRTIAALETQLLSSQAPFSVQPRVFDERFPHFVLYVQDVEAAATRWRGVFLASSSQATAAFSAHLSTRQQESAVVTTAEDAQIIVGPAQGQLELDLGRGGTHEYDQQHPDQYNVTTFGETAIPIDVSLGASPQKTTVLSATEEPVGALLADNGPDWRLSRVEFQRRIAFPAACVVFALLGVPIGVRPRRGGRAAGLILTLVLIGGYYFAFVWGDHMAAQDASLRGPGCGQAILWRLLWGFSFSVESRTFAGQADSWSGWRGAGQPCGARRRTKPGQCRSPQRMARSRCRSREAWEFVRPWEQVRPWRSPC
jgi:LPS export ABC transporter permease LptF